MVEVAAADEAVVAGGGVAGVPVAVAVVLAVAVVGFVGVVVYPVEFRFAFAVACAGVYQGKEDEEEAGDGAYCRHGARVSVW